MIALNRLLVKIHFNLWPRSMSTVNSSAITHISRRLSDLNSCRNFSTFSHVWWVFGYPDLPWKMMIFQIFRHFDVNYLVRCCKAIATILLSYINYNYKTLLQLWWLWLTNKWEQNSSLIIFFFVNCTLI